MVRSHQVERYAVFDIRPVDALEQTLEQCGFVVRIIALNAPLEDIEETLFFDGLQEQEEVKMFSRCLCNINDSVID